MIPPKPPFLRADALKISIFTPYLPANFLIFSEKEIGVKWLGGVLIRSLTKKVCSAIISARFAASLACAVVANLVRTLTCESACLLSSLLFPLNSWNE